MAIQAHHNKRVFIMFSKYRTFEYSSTKELTGTHHTHSHSRWAIASSSKQSKSSTRVALRSASVSSGKSLLRWHTRARSCHSLRTRPTQTSRDGCEKQKKTKKTTKKKQRKHHVAQTNTQIPRGNGNNTTLKDQNWVLRDPQNEKQNKNATATPFADADNGPAPLASTRAAGMTSPSTRCSSTLLSLQKVPRTGCAWTCHVSTRVSMQHTHDAAIHHMAYCTGMNADDNQSIGSMVGAHHISGPSRQAA